MRVALIADCSRICRHFEAAEFVIIQQLRNRRIGPTERAIRVTPDADLAEPHGQRIIHQQTTN